MEWTAETIDSPYGNDSPAIPEAEDLSRRLRELTEETWIEFYEMMTPGKAADITPKAPTVPSESIAEAIAIVGFADAPSSGWSKWSSDRFRWWSK